MFISGNYPKGCAAARVAAGLVIAATAHSTPTIPLQGWLRVPECGFALIRESDRRPIEQK